MTKTPHRVWIEIERPKDDAEGAARAKLLSAMLKRLGVDRGSYPLVWWNERKRCYCFTQSSVGSFVEASDDGQWFNLEFFGRED